ncbi:DNA-binding protein RHL1-like isoform X2 [Diospyros lotus]|uniref:DNA-binding protein RHL1-like isoform X2 n=1 Tax=Diospyros lotus TaxID=55363 RepID=UPI00224EAB8D|nr:DNA-binding protein RHL1-like isoform X2 [Diospyros lotus]
MDVSLLPFLFRVKSCWNEQNHVAVTFRQKRGFPARQTRQREMGRVGKEEAAENAATEANPEAEERSRLRRLAFTKGILSESPAKSFTAALSPSKTVAKHHGRDILRKSQRKNRFLFSFPGLLAPISGGKIGELKDLGTKNPILYLEFPQGRMKLFGTIVYPKNRYLTLQFSKGGKNVMCEDYFDTMIVFSDAWWIGRKDENPEEAQLKFPEELDEAHHSEYDFKGGAGATSEMQQQVNKSRQKLDQDSPKTDVENDTSSSQNNLEDLPEVTPVRHSERTAGKRFNFAEASSGDDFLVNDLDTSEGEDKKGSMEHLSRDCSPGNTENSSPLIFDIDTEDAAACTTGQVQESALLLAKSKELSHSNHSSLVQTTISTLFNKVEEKPRNLRKSSSSKASSQNDQRVGSEEKTNLKDKGPRKRRKVEDRKAGSDKTANQQLEVEEDDIEEFSSTSQDTNGSDEDWTG